MQTSITIKVNNPEKDNVPSDNDNTNPKPETDKDANTTVPESDNNTNTVVPETDKSTNTTTPETDEDANITIPNTGYYNLEQSDYSSNFNAIPLIGCVSIIIISTIIFSVYILKKRKDTFGVGFQKRLLFALSIMAIILIFVSIIIPKTTNNGQAVEDDNPNTLSITASDINLAVDLKDEPVFTYAKGTVTVTSPTEAGYTLMAYTNNNATDLINQEKPSFSIKMLETTFAQPLTNNTWGISLSAPDEQTNTIFHGLPKTSDDALVLNFKKKATEQNDKTDIYFGFYLTPELPYGTYSNNATINYIAVANVVDEDIIVNYHGNGLYFDSEQTSNTNTVIYQGQSNLKFINADNEIFEEEKTDTMPIIIFTINQKTGTYKEPIDYHDSWYLEKESENEEPYWFSDESQVKGYLLENYLSANGKSLDIYAQNTYTVHFEANGGQGTMADQSIWLYTNTELANNTYTDINLVLDNWNTTSDNTGTSYSNGSSVRNLARGGEVITLYAHWICEPDKICYRDNGANSITTMGGQSVESNSSATLWASNYQREEYGFAGWNTKADGSGTKYGPNETIQTGDLSDEGLRLYAMWVHSVGTIQNWNECSNLSSGSVTALTDTRDDNTYAIAKLADGNCWMIENLRLGNNESMTLTPENTNTSANSTLPASRESFIVGTIYTYSEMNSDNTTNAVSVMSSPNENVFSYGNYYSQEASIGSNTQVSGSDYINSICPSGWHLPRGGESTSENGSFSYLNNQFSSADIPNHWRTYPNNFVLSGNISNSIRDRGDSSVYFTSTRSSYDGIYGLMLSSNQVSPGTVDVRKWSGYSIRCISE